MKHLERFIGMMTEDERWHMIRLLRESMHGIEPEEDEDRPDLSRADKVKRPSKLYKSERFNGVSEKVEL